MTPVTPPRSLEFTDGFANRDGTPNADLPTTAVRMRLTEHDGRTRMELRFVFDSSEQMEQLERWGAFEVFPQSVGQMDALLAADMKTMTRWGPLSAPASPPPTPCSWVASSTTSGRYWPEHADEPFGDVMNSIKKYVVSNSLQAAEWQNSEIISGDVARNPTDIKARDGGDIAVSGSPTTVRSLLREVAVDELHLLVQPIVVGDGLARLFPPDEPSIPLELLSAQTFKTGVVNLSYAPAAD